MRLYLGRGGGGLCGGDHPNRPTSAPAISRPLIPDYAGANVRGIIPALLGPAGAVAAGVVARAACEAPNRWCCWSSTASAGSSSQEHRDADADAGVDGRRADHDRRADDHGDGADARIATGLTPASTACIGYRMAIGGEVLNVLRWNTRQRRPRGARFRRATCSRSRRSWATTCRWSRTAELRDSAFSRGPPARRAPRSAGGRASTIPVEVGRQLAAGERFVYAYYGGIDKIAHERGFGDVLRRRAALRRPPRRRRARRAAARRRPARHRRPRPGRTSADRIVQPDADLLRVVHAAVRRGPLPVVARPPAARPTSWPAPAAERYERHRVGRRPRPDARREVVRPDDRRRRSPPASATSPSSPTTRQLPRSGRLRPVRARLPARLADAGRGARAAPRRAAADPTGPDATTGAPMPDTEHAEPVRRPHRGRRRRPGAVGASEQGETSVDRPR